jgi:CheY-like chemotaxis protein
VLDTGPGIPLAEQQNIFREFHRLGKQASTSEGMGLGLAIVERACLLLQHPLTLISEVGRGTCFSLTLPFAPGLHRATPNPGQPVPQGFDPSESIVCLVENDTDLRLAMCLLLEKWRFNVIDVDTAEAALSLLDEIGILPDKFLIDFQLGDGMDGIELVQTLRARYGTVSALMITANRAPEMRHRCAELGLPVAHKPIDAKDLAAFLST